MKNLKLTVKKFEWGDEHIVVLDSLVVANISRVHYYDANQNIKVKGDNASQNSLESTLVHQTDEGAWAPISFASRYLKTHEKKFHK